ARAVVATISADEQPARPTAEGQPAVQEGRQAPRARGARAAQRGGSRRSRSGAARAPAGAGAEARRRARAAAQPAGAGRGGTARGRGARRVRADPRAGRDPPRAGPRALRVPAPRRAAAVARADRAGVQAHALVGVRDRAPRRAAHARLRFARASLRAPRGALLPREDRVVAAGGPAAPRVKASAAARTGRALGPRTSWGRRAAAAAVLLAVLGAPGPLLVRWPADQP